MLGDGCIVVGSRAAVGDIGDSDMIGVDGGWDAQANDLTGGVGGKLGRIDAIVETGCGRVFLHLEHIEDRVRVEAANLTVIFEDCRVIIQGGWDIAM